MTGRRATHDISVDLDRGLVVKRFRSWDRGEPAREWTALTLLTEFAPNLAPAPIHADLDGVPPAIAMSWLPGMALSDAPLSSAQADALVLALEMLWQSVPPIRLVSHPGTIPNSMRLTNQVRAMLKADRLVSDDELVRVAYQAGTAWLRSGALDAHVLPTDDIVLGQGDSNLANFLWDGRQIRIVDFEDSGPSDKAFELGSLVEHLSVWSDASLDAESFLAKFDQSRSEKTRLREFRRLAALFWLLLLLPGGPASDHNPPGTLRRQARRLMALLD